MVLSRRGLLAPQNTFIENVIRITSTQQSNFILCNARLVDFPIIYCDPGFSQLSGFSRVELMQQDGNCTFMKGEGTDESCIERLELCLTEQMPETMEILFYKKNKSKMWLKTTLTPIKNEDDDVTLFLITFKDITALKQMDDDSGKITSLGMLVRLAKTVSRSMAKHPSPIYQSGVPQVSPMFGAGFDTHKSSQDTLFSNEHKVPRYCQEVPRTPANILIHYSPFKGIWDWLILILTLYTAVMVPYNAAFEGKTMDSIPILVIDSVVDVVFFIDIMLNFHMTFVGPEGEVVSDPAIIRINYLKSWFVIDLLSCLPYDVFNAFNDAAELESVSSFFSSLKVIRLLRLGRVARKLDQYIEYGAAFLVLLIVMFALIAHWFACIWYTIGSLEASKGIQFGWLQRLGEEINAEFVELNGTKTWAGGPSESMSYASALYYTLSCMTSVGFGNISPTSESEKVFTICLMILGSLFYATIFGNVTTIFQQMYSTTGRYHEMLKNVKDFIKLHDVPKALNDRIVDFVVSTWSINKGIDSEKVLNFCPADMRADICVHLNRDVFSQHQAFQLASEGCLRALAVHFSMSHWAPGDTLFHQGESLDSLCFIMNGSLEIMQDEQIVAILTKGDVVGDQFWRGSHNNQCMANVRALTYCDLHLIKSDKLKEVLNFYQQFYHHFKNTLKVTYNLKKRAVFRKLSDIRKEQELDTKKEDTILSENHPVRKIISRFRKMSLAPHSMREEQQLNGAVASGKGIISKLKKAASMRRGSAFTDSQNLLDSPVLNSPATSPQALRFIETTALDTPKDGADKEGKENSEISHKKKLMLQLPKDIIEEEGDDQTEKEEDLKNEEKSEIIPKGGRFQKKVAPTIGGEHNFSQKKKRNSKKGLVTKIPPLPEKKFRSFRKKERKPRIKTPSEEKKDDSDEKEAPMMKQKFEEEEEDFVMKVIRMRGEIKEEVRILNKRMDVIEFYLCGIVQTIKQTFLDPNYLSVPDS